MSSLGNRSKAVIEDGSHHYQPLKDMEESVAAEQEEKKASMYIDVFVEVIFAIGEWTVNLGMICSLVVRASDFERYSHEAESHCLHLKSGDQTLVRRKGCC